jgi:tetratricopeptide (TPR) repeat protein
MLRRVAAILLSAACAAGCSAEYRAERRYWQAEQVAAPILKNPQAARPEQMAAAAAAYARVIQRVPGTLWAARAQGRIATLHVLQQDYDQARLAYQQLVRLYGRYPQLCLWAQQALARTYEAQDRWPEAVAAYEDLVEAHPWSQAALGMPLYVARGQEQRQPEQAERAYQLAVNRYLQWAARAPTAEVKVAIKHYLANAYQRLKQWPEAIGVLQELANQPNDPNRPLTLVTLGAIYQEKLQEPALAKAAYVQLIEAYPDHPLVQTAREQLERLPASSP